MRRGASSDVNTEKVVQAQTSHFRHVRQAITEGTPPLTKTVDDTVKTPFVVLRLHACMRVSGIFKVAF